MGYKKVHKYILYLVEQPENANYTYKYDYLSLIITAYSIYIRKLYSLT